MRVRLTRKLAEQIDGVNLAGRRVGDVINLPEREANLLLAEQWAQLVRAQHVRRRAPPETEAADHSRRRKKS